MCTVNAAMTGAKVVVDAIKVFGIIQEKRVNDYNANQLFIKAKTAENNAAYERQIGIEEARRKRLDSIKNMERQKAIIASGNIMTSSETALSLVNDEKSKGELDAIDVLNTSENKTRHYEQLARNYYDTASIQKFKTKQSVQNKLFKLFDN